MIKKILPAMIGVALAGGMSVAAADVTVFGHIDTSLDSIDNGSNDDLNMNCTTCSIGFKGSEDLGNGLKAIFKLDFQYDTTERNGGKTKSVSATLTPSSSLGSAIGLTTTTTISVVTSVPKESAITDRDQWLGLAGNFGKVRIGTISTGYKSHGAMIDPLYRTSLQGRDRGLQSSFHRGAGENLQGRATNTVRWDSPSFNGLNVVAHYTFDSNDATDGNDPYGIGASYENGGILVFADYIDNNGSASDSDGEKSAWKIGGKYNMGMFSFSGQYEDYSNNATDDETVWQVAGTAGPLFGITGYLGFGFGEDDTSNDEYMAWTLALMHSMSKSTMVYGGFSQVDCDAPRTLSACGPVGSGGGEDDKFSVGLKHKF